MNFRLSILITLFSFTSFSQSQDIYTQEISPTDYCKGATAIVSFITTQNFNAGNIFTAQLSDQNGNFTNPLDIGLIAAISTGSIQVTFPYNVQSGGVNYKVRVIGSDPFIIGTIGPTTISFNGGTAPIPPSSISANTTAICSGQSVQLTIVGGDLGSANQWVWYQSGCGSGSPVAIGNSAIVNPTTTTTYYVRAEGGSCGMSDCASITIEAHTPSTQASNATATPTNLNCSGDPTILNVTGGTLGVGAQWKWYANNCGSENGGIFIGTGAQVIANPSVQTTYYVRAENLCGNTICVSTPFVTFNNNGSVVPTGINITFGNDTLCNNGNVRLAVQGGSLGSGAQWNWYSGSCGGALLGTGTQININVTTTTSYYVRAEGGSCPSTACVTITIYKHGNLSGGPSNATANPSTICNGFSTILSVTGSVTGSEYSWKWYENNCGTENGGIFVGSGEILEVFPPSGITNYYVRAENSCDKTNCDFVNVHRNNDVGSTPPTAINSSSSYACENQQIQFSVVGGSLGTGAQWQWYSDSCGGTLVGTGAQINVSPGSTTTYYVRAEGNCNVTSCASVVVNVYTSSTPAAQVNISQNNTCPGAPTTLSIVGGSLGSGAQWRWYTNSCGQILVGSGPSVSVSPTISTTYYVRAEGFCNVTSCIPATIQVTQVLSIAPTGATATPDAICPGQTVVLEKVGGSLGTGAEWKWYSGSCGGTFIGVGPTIIVNPTVTTVYYVRAEGDCNITDCANVTVDIGTLSTDPTGITINPNGICSGEFTTLSVVGGSLGEGASWKWYKNSCGGIPAGTGSSIQLPVFENTVFYVRAEGACNITNCAIGTVTLSPVTIVSADAGTDQAICRGESVQIGGNPTAVICNLPTGAIYNWSPDAGLSSPAVANPIASPDTTTMYYLTVADGFGVEFKDSVKITVNDLPVLGLSGNSFSICEGNSTQLSATGTGNFSWNPTTGLDNPSSPTPIANPDQSTNYIVTLTDANNCSSEASVFVNVFPQPTLATSGNTSLCKGNSVQLEAFTNSNTVTWSPSTGLSNPNVAFPVADPVVTTTYNITAGTANCNSQSSLIVTVYDEPNPRFTYTYPGLSVQFQSANTTAVTYLWEFGDNTTSTQATPTHVYAQANTYNVCLTVSNSCGTVKYCNEVPVKVQDSGCCR